MSDRSVPLAGDPFAAVRDPEGGLLEAAEAALNLLDRMDAHMPEGLAFGGEGRVRGQLRTAIRAAHNEAEHRQWADAEDQAEAEALDDLRGALGRTPSDGERRAFLEGFRQRRAELLGRTRGLETAPRT